MKYNAKLFLLLWFITNSIANAQIITTDTINSSTIEKIDKLVDKDTVIFIELDEVLVMPKSKMFHYNDNPSRLFIQNLINLSNQNDKYLAPLIQWYQQRKLKLVEDGWQAHISSWKARRASVYGLCQMPIQLKNIEQSRLLEITKLGIEFSEQISNQKTWALNSQDNWSSVFYHGIIFTGPFSKSQSIIDLIKVTNISPKKIIVFDNIQSDLEMIEYSPLKTFRIEMYSILYQGARQFIDKSDPAIIALQQKTLLEENKWLEDEQAKTLLKTFKENK